MIGLGANLGARFAALHLAQRLVDAQPGTRVRAWSSVYESPPLGPPQPDYLNAAVLIESELGPIALLERLQAIEQRLGRQRRSRWGPRVIDLDVLWSDAVVDGPALHIPHAGLEERWWALAPLLDVAPFLRPRYGPSLAALSDRRPPKTDYMLGSPGAMWASPVVGVVASDGDTRVLSFPLPTEPGARMDGVVSAALALPQHEPSGQSGVAGTAHVAAPVLSPVEVTAGRWPSWRAWAQELATLAPRGQALVGAQAVTEGERLCGVYAWTACDPRPGPLSIHASPDGLEVRYAPRP